jgi:hypothetical protein
MRKVIGLVIGFVLLTSLVFGYGVETVKDDNDGNKGYILINTGIQQGGNDVGHWTDIKDVPELKGDKGDKGDTGATGQQGIQGIQGLQGDPGIQGIQGFKGDAGAEGLNGIDGQNGLDGLNGVDGNNGLDGINGAKGDTGEQGIQGLTGDKGDLGAKGDNGEKGNNGDKGDIGLQGLQGIQGLIGIQGITGKDVDPKEVKRLDNKNLEQDNRINNLDSRIGKLERTQFVLETSFRILDTKRISLRPFFRQNFTRNKVDVVGLKIDVKLGQSYEEKLIAKVNARLDLLEKTIGNAPVIEKVVDKKGNVKSISIIGNGLSVKGDF